MEIQPLHLLFIFVVALLIFGPGRLPDIGRGVGQAIREFQRGVSGMTGELMGELQETAPTAPVAQGPAAPAPAPAAASAPRQFCIQCGSPNPLDAGFCNQCGAPLPSAASAAAATVAAPPIAETSIETPEIIEMPAAVEAGVLLEQAAAAVEPAVEPTAVVVDGAATPSAE